MTYKGELTGRDLQAMGLKGKAIGEALSAIKLAVIDGEIKTREEEEEFLRTHILNAGQQKDS